MKKESIPLLKHGNKVGRITQPIARIIRRKSANIYLTDNYIRHIFNNHAEQIEALGYTPKEFVILVMKDFNRIYKGNGNSLLLVKWNGSPKVVAIELNYSLKNKFYEVKTAQIRAKNSFNSKALMWEKQKKEFN